MLFINVLGRREPWDHAATGSRIVLPGRQWV